LPTCELGRIGLNYYRKDPKIVYAIIDCEKIGGGVVPGYLGVVTESNTQGGVKITSVTENSPAQKANLKAGDVITALDKVGLKNEAQFSAAIQKTKPEQKVALTILRDKQTINLEVTLGERPEIVAARRPQIGVGGENVPAGAKILFLSERGAAAQAGLLVNDVIVSFDKKKIKSFDEFRDALATVKPGAKFTLGVQRGKDVKDVVITMPQPPRRTTARPYSFWYGGQRENVQDSQGPDSHEYGGVYRSEDGGESWKRVNSVNPRPMYFS